MHKTEKKLLNLNYLLDIYCHNELNSFSIFCVQISNTLISSEVPATLMTSVQFLKH